ncbi:histidinol-phosphate transaminase [Siccirubricoccus phaeus]|uniref:histidinol-phosphate transaminase n=1 Tax=Siccirubricoccus phaeus TaxID=2595053 RepID=UPI0011F2B389|nr:histidinol-phosphate transaminase [Siccirubricoccus phaeus]
MPSLLPRPTILSIEPYVGGESKVPGVNRIVKLSSNEGAFGVPPGAKAAYVELAGELHRYPDGGAGPLRAALGARFGLDPARIVCGNGSDEIIAHLILAYGGEGTELVMSAHGFVMYDIAGRYAGCQIIKVPEKNLTADVDALLAAVGPRTKLMFLANPNNPTGSMLPAAEVARLRAGLREDVLLVLDSAYAEYVTRDDYDAGAALVEAGTNTVMTRTFSKVFGLGGLRLGWCYGPAQVIDVLNRVRGPFNVNAPAMAAGIAALAEPGWVEKSVAHNTEWRAKLSAALTEAGIVVHPSEGNFILADFATAARARAADAALKARGLIVRAMGAYSLPQCLRITVGTAEECMMVAEALTAFMRSADAA